MTCPTPNIDSDIVMGWGAASMSGQQPERSAKSGQGHGRGREGDLQNERDVASVVHRDAFGHLPHNGRTNGVAQPNGVARNRVSDILRQRERESRDRNI